MGVMFALTAPEHLNHSLCSVRRVFCKQPRPVGRSSQHAEAPAPAGQQAGKCPQAHIRAEGLGKIQVLHDQTGPFHAWLHDTARCPRVSMLGAIPVAAAMLMPLEWRAESELHSCNHCVHLT